MKIVMLVGKKGCGKTTFCQAINGQKINYKKTQTTEIVNNAFIDTPGEYIENRMYSALMVISADCDIIAIFQDCTELENMFPPGFVSMFSKPVIGVVTKLDICEDNNNIYKAEQMLKLAGAERIFKISSVDKRGLDELKKYIGKY